jgi:autotransporter translocation and assembly factor TamB
LVKLGLTTAGSPVCVTEGILDEVTIRMGKAADGDVALQTLAGRFSGVATSGALEIKHGSARFEKVDKAVQFMEGQALYQGQPIAVAGRVLTAADDTGTLDFSVQMPAGNPAVLLPSLRTSGSLAVQATIAGPVLSPVLAGNFTLGGIQLGDMSVSGISGAFTYTQQVLRLLSSRGTAIGGSVAASGDIYPDKEQYSLSISGSGLDSSRLTEKDVKGPLSLVGAANGEASAARVQGSFSIDNGTAYGIPFQTLSGSFSKRGSAAAEVSNLAIQTGLGTFYPDQLSQTVMEELQARSLPITQEQVTEVFADRLFKKLFR